MVDDTQEVRRTPLYDEHVRLGAKMVDFAGWSMPVEYQGLRAEHLNTRENVGLFDVSHMGEVRVRGGKSIETLQWLTVNDVAKLGAGQAQYSILPNDQGGVVDDIIIYCVEPGQDYLVCVNAANTDKDFQWMLKHNRGAEITNESDNWGQIAVQGPKAMELLIRIFGDEVRSIRPFHFAALDFSGSSCLVARTGYTGEDGAEVFVPAQKAADLWRTLLQQGEDLKASPVGLGARDTLRTEMKFSLYGHEIDDTTNPYAAGLGWVIKPDAKDFIGKESILKGKAEGLKERLVGFKMVDKGIPRAGYELYNAAGEKIGRVTSGTPSPSLQENIGIGYVKTPHGEVGEEVWVDIRGRKLKMVVVKTPFVQTKRS